ncbi:VOC family protein [Paenibacillus sp. NPDC057967]|uniref:VOC family protein n=1 Tax=Paenibacillus sp. NPDC057967 TaxID=3346293 RepID=UPI0036D7F1EF
MWYNVSNLERTISFYTNGLGFTVDYQDEPSPRHGFTYALEAGSRPAIRKMEGDLLSLL